MSYGVTVVISKSEDREFITSGVVHVDTKGVKTILFPREKNRIRYIGVDQAKADIAKMLGHNNFRFGWENA